MYVLCYHMHTNATEARSLGIGIQTFVSHCVGAGLLILGLLQEQVVLTASGINFSSL